ncbi:MAG: glutamine synthetase type III [Erysipelotrichaceae bacterium]|nr:glutamine synthetase type III [Erysipelotrichaceae bacterium]
MSNHPFKDFAVHLFSDSVIKERCPEAIYQSWKTAIAKESPLDRATADSIAQAMKDWSMSLGATHYSHWFQPLTGNTAEKHDSFLDPDSKGKAITVFSGKALIKGETDGSSFPSGGLRATFEARGYTYWDITSPAFIRDNVLCIPSIFVSYNGEPLDQKAPLLKALEALSREATRVTQLLGDKSVKHVKMMVGAEQEYFLVDKAMYEKRKDLLLAGRTLVGASAPKGQELEDHYFGSISHRVKNFMEEVNHELWKVGIYAKVEHNEVAPAQFELCPVFKEANIAVDQNQIMMDVLKKTAKKHGMECLLHEKPFKGINGSGKHNNWSLITDDGQNLLEPGDKPHENVRFLLVVASILKAIDTYPEILRLSASGPGNDHRLGANEAPPAIISVFLGDLIEDIFMKMLENTPVKATEEAVKFAFIKNLAYLPKDYTDRNRTSPFAFTGNKFEFRMIGSSLSIATPITMIATIVADTMRSVADRLEPFKYLQDTREEALKIVVEILKKHKRVLFNGDGYSEAWVTEAAKRGLPNISSFVESIGSLTEEKALVLFERNGIYTRPEVQARSEILYELYIKTIQVETRTFLDMVSRQILPAGENEIIRLLPLKDLASPKAKLAHLTSLTTELSSHLDALKGQLAKSTSGHEHKEQGLSLRKDLVPLFEKTRALADELEALIPIEDYPIPCYTDLLFQLD